MRKQNRRKREQHNQKNTKQLFIQLLSEFSGHSQATIQRVWMTVQNPPVSGGPGQPISQICKLVPPVK